MNTIQGILSPVFIILGIVIAGHLVVATTHSTVTDANGSGRVIAPFAEIKAMEADLDRRVEAMQQAHYPNHFVQN